MPEFQEKSTVLNREQLTGDVFEEKLDLCSHHIWTPGAQAGRLFISLISLISLEVFEELRIRGKDERTIFVHGLFVNIQGLNE